MAGYFEEMGWQPLGDGETPDNLLHLARFLLEFHFVEPEADSRLPPPAAAAAVAALPDVAPDTEDGNCTVCLKSWQKGDQAKEMPCKHLFHPQCINPWLQKTNSCPLCRHELPTDDPEYEERKKRKLRAIQREKDIEILHDSMFS